MLPSGHEENDAQIFAFRGPLELRRLLRFPELRAKDQGTKGETRKGTLGVI